MLPVNLIHFSSEPQKQKLPEFTTQKLKIIENSNVFSVMEKVNLLLLFLDKKWITELDIDLKNKTAYANELARLQLPWAINFYTGEHKSEWIQVGKNQAVLDYVMQNNETLSELEAGVLYGYPLTHILGFMGVLKSRRKHPSAMAATLAGVYSYSFYEEEVEFFNKMWKEIELASPAIADKARAEYLKNYPKNKK